LVKFNHNELLTYPNKAEQITWGTIKQCWDLGATAVGATVYFGSADASRQIVEVSQMFQQAHELGMATLLMTTAEKAAELSPRPEIDIRLVAKAEVRANPSLMPEAPALAVQKLLSRTGMTMAEMAVVKNHNPFAVNDAVFSKVLDYDWKKMNETGCSLVWGHPQGPTLTRSLIEGLEEVVVLGGGNLLLFGCAAGDVGIAAVLHVNDNTAKISKKGAR
jgi:acetyl-CoA acetyltransferase